MNDDRLIDQAQGAIRAYLARRPDAADTLEGIHRWWIQWGEAVPPEVTRMALERLQAEGSVEALQAAGRQLWRGRRH